MEKVGALKAGKLWQGVNGVAWKELMIGLIIGGIVALYVGTYIAIALLAG